MSDKSLTAAGGWCAPSTTLYDALSALPPPLTFVMPSVRRGGITFGIVEHRTPVEQHADRVAADWQRLQIAGLARQRHEAVDAACLVAMAEGWDVHVYEPPQPFSLRRVDSQELLRLAAVGIQFTPRKHPVPTIHYHLTPDCWDDEDYFNE